MKTEHQFNAFLSKEFKKRPEYKAVKISDRFKIGLPDWLIFHEGRAVAVECKFAKQWKDETAMLGHAVSPPQIATLRSFDKVDVPASILIGIAGDRFVMYLGHHSHLTKSGNATGDVLYEHFVGFYQNEIDRLLTTLFSQRVYG